MKNDFMKEAIICAKTTEVDIPVGAVVVKNGEIIAYASNEKEKNNDVSAHAEIVAIKKASKILNNWRLNDCDLYVTLEPCPMCAWAILQSRIKNVYFGSYDTQYGAFGSKINLSAITNSDTKIKGGILEAECDSLLNDFFKRVRK